MRTIDVEPGLRVRFPGRSTAFDEGVEIGLLVGRMAAGLAEFEQTLAAPTLDQATALAARLGYWIEILQSGDDDRVTLSVSRRRKKARPARLTLIHDRAWG